MSYKSRDETRIKEKIAKFLYYVEDVALEDIGDILKLTKGRVSQLIKKQKRGKRVLVP